MAGGCSFLLTLLDWGDSVSLVFSPLYDYEDFDDDDGGGDDGDDGDEDEANDGDANKSQRQRQKLHSGFRETKTYF